MKGRKMKERQERKENVGEGRKIKEKEGKEGK